MSKCKFWTEEEVPYEMNKFYGTDVTCKYIVLQNYFHKNYLTHKVQYCIKNAFAQKNSCSCNGNEKNCGLSTKYDSKKAQYFNTIEMYKRAQEDGKIYGCRCYQYSKKYGFYATTTECVSLDKLFKIDDWEVIEEGNNNND